MRVLVICPHFEPDSAPTGALMTRIVEEFASQGDELHVITSFPWYRNHALEQGWGGRLWRRERVEWGRITRIHPFPTKKSNLAGRAVAFSVFTVLATVFGVFSRRKPDVVFAMSPPLTLGFAGAATARLRRVPVLFNIQDVFPDVAIELGKIKNPLLVRFAKWLERRAYSAVDMVTVLSEDLRENVASKGADARFEVVPNFVDTDMIRPLDRETSYRDELGVGDKTVVLYAGNVGFSQSLDLLVGAARHFQTRADVAFVINGEGSALEQVRADAAGLPNLVFRPYQAPERLPEVLAAGDIHTVLLKTGLARSSVPSKLYSIMAAQRAVIASVDERTQVQRTIEEAGCGIAVPPDDLAAFIDGLESLLDASADLAQLGRAGREYVEQEASPAAVANAYRALLEELIEAR